MQKLKQLMETKFSKFKIKIKINNKDHQLDSIPDKLLSKVFLEEMAPIMVLKAQILISEVKERISEDKGVISRATPTLPMDSLVIVC